MRVLPVLLSLLTAVGCDDDGKIHNLPDAPPAPDAAPDASTTGPVALTVTFGSAPVAGVKVIFQNADSSVVSETTTGTNGVASAEMGPGGYVTAIDPFPSAPRGIVRTELRTFVAVKPGDQLALHTRARESAAVNVTLVGPIDPNAGSYLLYTSCGLYDVTGSGGSGSPPGGPLSLIGCGPTTDLVIESRDFGGARLATLAKLDVALVEGGTIDLSAESYAAIPDATFSYTNLPVGVAGLNLFGQLVTPRGPLLDVFGAADVTGGAAELTLPRPTVAGTTAVNASTFSVGGNTMHMVLEWGPIASAYALDASGLLLPEITGAPTLTPATHDISWTAAGSPQPDFVRIAAFLTRETPLQDWRWELIAPAASSPVALPVLPMEVATYNPIEGDTSFLDLTLGKAPGGYDAVRAVALSLDGPEGLAQGAMGRAVFATYLEGKTFLQPSRTPWPFGSVKTRRR